MQVYVHVADKCISVPCSDGTKEISWLLGEVRKRSKEFKLVLPEKVLQLTTVDGGILYSCSDVISDVLDDKQFVRIKLPDQTNYNGDIDIYHLTKELKKTAIIKRSKTPKIKHIVELDGSSLTTGVLWSLSGGDYKIKVSLEAERKVRASRKLLDEIVEENKVVYGVSTGFGKFARVVIPPEDLKQLQVNLIESHCAGVGNPLPPERARMVLALRINVLCKGYSGISTKNLGTLVDAFNASCLPMIPDQGTVGASGDLAPLSHIALGLMGKGKMWSPSSGWSEAKYVLEANGISPLDLTPKEGLALINGTQFICALGSEATERSLRIAQQADVVAALTLEALQGTSRAFDPAIHEARPHSGQLAVAKRMRSLLNYGGDRSEISNNHANCGRVQDAYTLRCCPQVHGIAHDTVHFVKGILDVELNSATDNPMVLIDRQETISGGNFHGEYPAKALDFLAIGIHELSSISERRIERLCNPAYSDLPAFLVQDGGLNSGYMIPHCTAAALVSENKVLCHPSSVDSLSTSAGQEDHVSMGGFSARKALNVVANVERVIAIELLCACQGIDFHRPLKTTEALEAVHSLVRSHVPTYDKDRVHYEDIETVARLLRENKVWEAVEPFLELPALSFNLSQYSCSPTSSQIIPPSLRQDR